MIIRVEPMQSYHTQMKTNFESGSSHISFPRVNHEPREIDGAD